MTKLAAFGRSCLCLLLALSAVAAPAAHALNFDDVAARAKALSEKPYAPPEQVLPDELGRLGYEQYQKIRYRPEQALWAGGGQPFQLQFFHPGLGYTRPVTVNIVGPRGSFEQKYQPAQFDFGGLGIDLQKLGELRYAGLRVHAPVNQSEVYDEVLAFQGADQFRALGQEQRYGQSARGLAVDTALLSGEEFPQFREFWVVAPEQSAKTLRIYALLDSPRVAGAYQFVLEPGKSTTMDVSARLFLRAPVGKLGLAPLTSMYFFGENQPSKTEDYRPEVHDVDGLLVSNGDGEWIWRPLTNPRRLQVTSFSVNAMKGFGLLQRDRNFDHYQDLSARYELRPSTWVEPTSDWGSGRVELVQIPLPDETNNNIVAYYVRDVPPPVGQPFDFSYRLSWTLLNRIAPPTSQVVQTRQGEGFPRSSDDNIRMTVDFEGPALALLPTDASVVAALSISDNAELLERSVVRNQVTGGWRLIFRFHRKDPSRPVDMRASLRHGGSTVSETWAYVLHGN